ncbi:MAG: hypothetical protein ACD_22C00237G0013 [uncultured bacterium]|nr:MAG: hypothetical protein ACD_22C00237G0013 [uncultured bacterium]
MTANPLIFRTYDIRGVFPTDINEDFALHVGKAFGTYLQKRGLSKCVLGRDDRQSSPTISKKVSEGLLSTGCDVVDVGITLTPLIHFFTSVEDFDAGINVTGSHNPINYNGIKFEFRHAVPFAGDNLKSLIGIMAEEKYAAGCGVYTTKDYLDLYIQCLQKQFKFTNNLSVLFDCGNGATSEISPKVAKALGINLTPLDCTYDPDFPNGVPDPSNQEFMGVLSKKVVEAKADVGFAFDTDGDRVGVVDEKGTVYKNDETLLLLAEDALKRFPGGKIIYDIKSSELVDSVIREKGGIPTMMKTGRSFFLEEMKKGAILGSELSGHTYFGGDYFGFDDGMYAAFRIIQILQEKGKKLSELMSNYPKRVASSEIKLPIEDCKKNDFLEKVVSLVKKSSEYAKVLYIDGVRAYISNTGWFLVRVSGTSPYISIRYEGKDQEEYELLQKKVEELLRQV